MINNKKILSIVMSRANSVGLPGKSVKPLMGEPCFMWSLLASVKSKYIDMHSISCCCPDVKNEYSKSTHLEGIHNVFYIDRPEVLNGATVKNEEVSKHAYYYFKDNLDFDADVLITLQSTSPIRTDNLIDKCLEKMEEDGADSLLTVTKNFPFIWYDYGIITVCPNMYYLDRPMRQDLKESDFALIDNGNIYITNRDVLLSYNNRLGKKVSVYETTQYQSLQIDTIDDFNLIEKVCEVNGYVI